MSAFEQITSRLALPAEEIMKKYYGVEIGAKGTFVLATGARPFAGVVQYGAEAAGDYATVVQGIFPVLVSAEVALGARLKADSSKPGLFVTALDTEDAVGIALEANAGTAGITSSMLMVFSAGQAAG